MIMAQGDSIGRLYDDAPKGLDIHGRPIYDAKYGEVLGPLIISIGSNNARRLVSERYHVKYAKAIHPTAVVSSFAEIGDGTVVMPGAIIQADATIGRHCIINTGASIDHECVIDDFAHVSPHATLCGNVRVGKGTLIGAGAIVIPGVRIGEGCTVGAGSVVLHDIPDNSTAYGDPCRVVFSY